MIDQRQALFAAIKVESGEEPALSSVFEGVDRVWQSEIDQRLRTENRTRPAGAVNHDSGCSIGCDGVNTQRQFTIAQRCYKLVIRIEVIDNGPGIPIDMQETIFYPMITGRADGTGLGLSVVHGAITSLGGQIDPRLEGATLVNRERPDGSRPGVLLAEVEAGSPAWYNSLRSGDLILSVNRRAVNSVDELVQVLADRPRTLLLNIQRGRQALFVLLQ